MTLSTSKAKSRYVAIFLFLLFQSGWFSRSIHAESVQIAYSSISGAMAPLWVASDYGLFQRQGLQVQLLYIGGGSVVTQALLGGDVQFVRLGANAVVQASMRGANLKMIANTINTLVFSLMSRPEIQSAKDLKGKKIGVTRLGGSTDFALELALKKWGLRRGTDIAVLQTGGMPQLLGAITAGIVDAGVISPPTNLSAAKLGLRELVDFGEIGITYPNSPLATTQLLLEKNRNTALRVLRAYCEGIHRVRTDREGTIKVLAKYTKVRDVEILSELYRIYGTKYLEPIPKVKLEAVDEVLRSEVKSSTPVKATDFVDNSLVAELEQQGLFQELYR
ncbi:MAG TPA: ABC transporter substrate-binding protein [Candidatus Udaeobacter sp.]|nr:ABC transporter substrate-binding protein [Candidatus Udaeobacter sp.]